MRKAFAILLTLLLLCTAGFAVAHFWVDGQKEAVTWEEETLYGDPSVVEGAVVQTNNHFRNHILWETEGTLGSTLKPVTKYTFSNASISSEINIRYEGIHMTASEDFLASMAFDSSDRIPAYAKEKYADLIAYCKACFESVEIGEEKDFTVDLSKYMDYYSLSGTFDYPDTDWHNFNEFEYYGHSSFSVAVPLIQGINDFFRIPIMGEYLAEFSINRRQNGVSFGGGAWNPYVYRPEFDSVYINDTCYLSFNAVAPNGEIADTSQIPGGYGLYRLNIRSDGNGGLIADDPIATMVYPMDPNEEFYYLEASDDEKHIYLHTWQGTKLMRTILDAETMECLQKIELVDQPEDFYREMKQYDDFLAILQLSINNVENGSNTVTVFTEDEQGLYHHRFTVPMNVGGLDVNDDLLIFSSVTERMDFKDDTLYVVQNVYRDAKYSYARGESPNFYVLAYRPEGLAYLGKYNVNLSQINIDPEYDDRAVNPWFDYPVNITVN